MASHINTNSPSPYTFFTPTMAQQMMAYSDVRVDVNDREVKYNDDDAFLSSINISISSPFTIKGDNNLVSLDPHQAASAMAQSIMGSINAASMAACGVPMIGESGIPRPLKVMIEAALTIEGSGNTIGEKVFLKVQQPDREH